MEELVIEYIHKDWSPEQVSATLLNQHELSLSFVRIYQYIETDKQNGGSLHTRLRFYGKKIRAKYGSKYKGRIKKVSISKRPEIVDEKIRIDDFEIDTIIGKGKQGAITTIVDRVSSFVKISIPLLRGLKILRIRRQDCYSHTKISHILSLQIMG